MDSFKREDRDFKTTSYPHHWIITECVKETDNCTKYWTRIKVSSILPAPEWLPVTSTSHYVPQTQPASWWRCTSSAGVRGPSSQRVGLQRTQLRTEPKELCTSPGRRLNLEEGCSGPKSPAWSACKRRAAVYQDLSLATLGSRARILHIVLNVISDLVSSLNRPQVSFWTGLSRNKSLEHRNTQERRASLATGGITCIRTQTHT